MEIIRYLFWGVATTVANIVSYYLFSQFIAGIFIPTTIAWIISIIFAYVTNTLFVFKEARLKIKQFVEFTLSRLSTLVIEIILMYVLVNLIFIDDMIAKIVVNVVVIILNYVISKLFVFKKKNN